MPFQPQRFIHAANVRLDVPVSVYLSEQLTDDLRHQLEDATLSSFDCVVDNCIQRKVDYLLLSGNLFVEADRSLRARLSLLSGFRRLNKQGIAVFVLPGDTDPPEAWRAIPELPDNVRVCFSSNPEPVALERGSRTVATVSASMWYGETDAFGIRVIHSSPDGIEPLRIGIASRAKFDESRRMARLSVAVEDRLISVDDEVDDAAVGSESAETETAEEYDEAFRQYMSKLMREGRLNYLALGSELQRTWINLESGVIHCPGTTQPRSRLEADCGLCSLVTVDTAGHVNIEEINTSAVDWKNLTLRLSAGTELNGLLEQMREELLDIQCSPSDQIWSVCWTLEGPLPVLQSFEADDVELAVAVELDQLDVDTRKIRLLHQVRLLPDAWDLDDSGHLAQQYSSLIPADSDSADSQLSQLPAPDELSEGWVKRLEALATGMDRQRLLAQLRADGADWFIADLEEFFPTTSTQTVDDIGIDDELELPATDTDATQEDAAGPASSVVVTTAEDDDSADSVSPS